MMLGLGSLEIALAFWLVILSSLLCIVYGIVNWNNGDGEDAVDPDREECVPGKPAMAAAAEEGAQ